MFLTMQNMIVFIYWREIAKNECCKAFLRCIGTKCSATKWPKVVYQRQVGEDVYRNISKVVKFSNTLSVEMAMLD